MNSIRRDTEERFIQIVNRLKFKNKDLQKLLNCSSGHASLFANVDEAGNLRGNLASRMYELNDAGISFQFLAEGGINYPFTDSFDGKELEARAISLIQKHPYTRTYQSYLEFINWRYGSLRNFCKEKKVAFFDVMDICGMVFPDTIISTELMKDGMLQNQVNHNGTLINLAIIPDKPYDAEEFKRAKEEEDRITREYFVRQAELTKEYEEKIKARRGEI